MQPPSSMYFETLEASQTKGCPVCRLLNGVVAEYLKNLLYENVNDGPTRESLRASLGFCRTHAEAFLSSGNPLGIAIIYRDILQEIVVTLHKRQNSFSSPSAECPACTQRNCFSLFYIDTLREHFTDEKMMEALRFCGGLCRIHLTDLFAKPMQEPSRSDILRLHTGSVGALRKQLSEFTRKQDIQFKNETMTDEEASACSTAIAFMVGTTS